MYNKHVLKIQFYSKVTIYKEENFNFNYSLSLIISIYAKTNLKWSVSNIDLTVKLLYNCMPDFKNKTKIQHMLN